MLKFVFTAIVLCAAISEPRIARAPTVLQNPSNWFANAYPPEAARARQQGNVVTLLEIDATGKITRCTVTHSSGSAMLDAATCRIVLKRGRYKPAINENGVDVASTAVLPMTWALQ